MLNLSDWQLQDFLNQNNYKLLKKQADGFLFYNLEREAYDLFNLLNKKLVFINKIGNSELKDAYLKIIQLLKFIALPRLNNKLVIDIFEKNLAELLNFDQQELNLKNKIRKKIFNLPLLERDDFKKQLLKALERNEQIITQVNIETENGQIDGSVANWVKLYYRFITENDIDRKLAKVEFLYKNKSVAKLNDKDRQKIEILLDLYDSWQKSSLTIEGNEDPIVVDYNGKLYGIYNGEVFNIIGGNSSSISNKQIKKQLTEAKIISRAANSINKQVVSDVTRLPQKNELVKKHEVKKINSSEGLQVKFKQILTNNLIVEAMKEMEKINQAGEYKMQAMRSQFYHAVNQRNAKRALAILFTIAKHGDLRQTFAADERFVKFWANYLKGHSLSQDEFNKDAGNAKDIARFLKYILEQRLSLSQEEALMTGALLASLCRRFGEKEYQQLVYGDLEMAEFRWNI